MINWHNERHRKKYFLNSFIHAFRGIVLLIKHEYNFRIHIIAAAIVTGAGFYFNISKFEWLILIITICIVMLAEAMNTAIEKLSDHVSDGNYHENIKKVKDVGAGAVLIAAIAAVIVGIIIFIPKIIDILNW